MSNCIYCEKKLPSGNRKQDGVRNTRSLEIATIDPDMLFCTLRCAARYGVMVARAAYPDRVKETK